ncbi:hypothetical protein ABZ318_38910, partial [Streptomyces sp. NPDC006197]|uniref:hypothetical protein n=1 Tax=Streptomyces sp. NPDC006197 TaxID=3156685 RepID=UPI0033A23E11
LDQVDQVKKTGAKIPVMGGDGIYDPAFISASAEAPPPFPPGSICPTEPPKFTPSGRRSM